MPYRIVTVWSLLFAGVLSILPLPALAQNPTTREYPTLYKSPRAMGMGGAYTAVGGRVDSLFYNPAGLSNIPQDKGWEVNLINVSAEYSKNAENFLKDMQDALDVPEENGQQQQAVNNVLAKYTGKELHLRVADFTSIGKSYDRWAFGVGGIGNGRIDAIPHQGFGSDGFLEVNADAIYGGIGGFSMGLTENFIGGISAKYLHRETLIHNFTALDFVNNQDNLSDYIQKDLRQSGNALGFDAGVMWKFAPDSPLKPSLGVSVMNIGDLDFGQAGKIPQTVNTGIAINPTISMFRSLTVAVDYIDVLNNFKQDKDMGKRLRYGAELQLFDIWPAEMALRAGMYEGSPTLGADLRLLVFTFSYVMYTEEIGAYTGQDKDKRQLLTVDIGW
jgi:hypothetical protein